VVKFIDADLMVMGQFLSEVI